MKKNLDYMWLARVSGSILLLLSIVLPFANELMELIFLVPFLCISADIVLCYYNKRIIAVIISIISVFAMVALFAQRGLTVTVSLWQVVTGIDSLLDFLYVASAVITIVCIPVVFILCCFNKRTFAMITSIIMALVIVTPVLVSMFYVGKLLGNDLVRLLGKDVIEINSLAGFLYAASAIFIMIFVPVVFILCCHNERTAATIICIVVALASIPALAYMEVGNMPMSIFYNAYVFLGGVLVIVWSWIMDSDFPAEIGRV